MNSLSLIVAVAENGVIGRDGTLPWHLPADLKRFKALTLGHAILMGRRTWESIGRALPGRRSLVLTRNPALVALGAETAGSLAEAIAHMAHDEEAFVIGGASLFAEAAPLAGTIHLTRVHAEIPGDVLLPPDLLEGWRLDEAVNHPRDARHAYPFTFHRWTRSLS